MERRRKHTREFRVGVALMSLCALGLVGYYKLDHAESRTSVATKTVSGRILVGAPTESSSAVLQRPLGLSVVDRTGNLYVADYKANKIIVFDPSGNRLGEIGRTGQGPGELLNPVDVDVAADKLYVLEAGNYRVSIYRLDGTFLRSFRTGPVSSDQRIAVSRDGRRIYLNEPTPMSGSLFTVYDSEGRILRRFGDLIEPKWGAGKFEMNTVCFDLDPNEDLVVFYCFLPIVQKYSREGALLYSGKLDIPEVPQKKRDLERLLKENPQGALVTYVDDVFVAPGGWVYIVVPPSREMVKKLTRATAVIYQLDPSLQPKSRLLWKMPDPVMQSYFDAFCVDQSGLAFATLSWAAALAKVNLQGLGSGLE